MRTLILSLIAAPLAFATLPAMAQGNPSANDIIQSLKPGGNLTQGTRGIKMANPGAAAPAAATTSSAAAPKGSTASTASASPKANAAPVTGDAGPSVSLTVEFATDSSELTAQARQTLDQLGRALSSQDLAQFHFRIEGHTDTVGSAAHNKALSQRRADVVAAYLEKNFGVAATRLEAVGLGQDGLLVPTPPQTANAQNRRVKVVNLGA
jgi:outer membrane protein OmpA-like peptidoglycan-associated protein